RPGRYVHRATGGHRVGTGLDRLERIRGLAGVEVVARRADVAVRRTRRLEVEDRRVPGGLDGEVVDVAGERAARAHVGTEPEPHFGQRVSALDLAPRVVAARRLERAVER